MNSPNDHGNASNRLRAVPSAGGATNGTGTNGSHTGPTVVVQPFAVEEPKITLADFRAVMQVGWSIVRRRWWLGALAALVVMGSLGGLIARYTPSVTARTTLLAKSTLDDLLNTAGDSTSKDALESRMRNHLSVMLSRTFRDQIVASFSADEIGLIRRAYVTTTALRGDAWLAVILGRALVVEREKGREFFTITVQHPDPEAALLIADRFTTQYRAYVQKEYRDASQQAVNALRGQVKMLSEKIGAMEDERRDFREEHNLVTVADNRGNLAERTRRLDSALTDVRVQRLQLQQQVDSARHAIAADPTPFDNPVLGTFGKIAELRADAAILRLEQKLLLADFGPKHPKRIANAEKLAGVEALLVAEFALGMADLNSRLDLAMASEKQLDAELTAVFRESLDLDRLSGRFTTLDAQLEAKRQTLVKLLEKAETADIGGELPSDVVRVIDPPFVITPALSRKTLFYGLAAALGCAVFLAVPFAWYVFDQRLSASSDVEKTLDTRLLGAIPRLARIRVEDRAHIVRDNVDRAHVECFLETAARLDLIATQPYPKRIIVTSTVPAEGKSLLVSNLAAAFTRLGKKTVIVDCDFRRPSQHAIHAVSNTAGVFAWAAAGYPMDDDLLAPGGPLGVCTLPDGTFLIASGGADSQPGRILVGSAIARLFALLRASFDVLIIDTPPAGLFQDALVLAKEPGETLILARDRRARTAQVKAVIDEFGRTAAPVAGLVLNDFSPSSTHPRLAHRYGYDRDGYAGHYGSGPPATSREKGKVTAAR